MEIIIGHRYRIKQHAIRPWHWNEEMDEWMGRIVTIKVILREDQPRDNREIFISEDNGGWVWGWNDFETIEQLDWDQ